MSEERQEESNILQPEESWLIKYLWPLLGTMILLVVAVVLFVYSQVAKASQEDEARTSFAKADDPVALKQQIEKYLGTDAAALEALTLASERLDGRNYNEAIALWDLFLENYPTHPLVYSARFGRAAALELLGRTDEALPAFQAVAQSDGQNVYAALAHLRMARLYDDAGKSVAARDQLEMVLQKHAQSPWAAVAKSQLQELNEAANEPGPGKVNTTIAESDAEAGGESVNGSDKPDALSPQ